MKKYFFFVALSALFFFVTSCGDTQNEPKPDAATMHQDSEVTTTKDSVDQKNVGNADEGKEKNAAENKNETKK